MRRHVRFPSPGRLAPLLLLAAGLTGCRDAESALVRGDRLWADSSYSAALAEYRLSQSLRTDSDEVLARVAHAYAVTGQFERAREAYDDLLRMRPATPTRPCSTTWRWRAGPSGAMIDTAWPARWRRPSRCGRDCRWTTWPRPWPASTPGPVTPSGPASSLSGPWHTRRPTPWHRCCSTTPSSRRIAGQLRRGHGTVQCVPQPGALGASGRTRLGGPWATVRSTWAGRPAALAIPGRPSATCDVMLDLGVPQNLLDQAWFERGEALLELGRRTRRWRPTSAPWSMSGPWAAPWPSGRASGSTRSGSAADSTPDDMATPRQRGQIGGAGGNMPRRGG
jgi:tetratricopeptide (TPR) repeat protein